MKSFSRSLVLVMCLGVFGPAAFAEEAPAAADQAMKEKIMKLTSPSEAHKALEQLAGKWNYTAKFWMTPTTPPDVSAGTGENSLVYGGRFLKQDIKGVWMGQPFEGLGYLGYDNIKGEYVTVWLDNMATGIMQASGQYDPNRKMFSLSGTNSCPLTGEAARQGRSETMVVDNDHHVYSTFAAGPDGKEFLMMEITYERAA